MSDPNAYIPWPDSRPSSDINVEKYELFLVWPVFVQPLRDANGDVVNERLDPAQPKFLDEWVKLICASGIWEPKPGAYPSREGLGAAQAYSEFVYFHPFVRQFLYTTRDDIREHARLQGRPDGPYTDDDRRNAVNRNLRILQRTDFTELRIKPWEGLEVCFEIESIWLYLFDTQVAMLEVKLGFKKASEGASLKLNRVMKLNDVVRRTFAAYWSVWGEREKNAYGDPTERLAAIGHSAGHCPFEIQLIARDNSKSKSIVSQFGTFKLESTGEAANLQEAKKAWEQGSFTVTDKNAHTNVTAVNEHLRRVYGDREQFASPIWESLLEPISPTKLGGDNQTKLGGDNQTPLRFEQILDERVPLFAYLAVDDPRRISPGDWVRLATVDDDGDSQTYPYGPDFLKPEYLKDFFYDRFWDATGAKPAQDNYQRTRWLFSGYGFVGVGPADDADFFTNAHSGALCHFRHHYFALGMIAHFHRASLLRFKHALAEAAEKLHDDEDGAQNMARFRERVNTLQQEFLRFRTRYWFAEISNQIQGREMFELWKKHLNTPALFADVAGDIATAEDVLRRHADDRRNGWLQRIALVGAVFAIAGPVVSIASEGTKLNPTRCAMGALLFLSGFLCLVLAWPGELFSAAMLRQVRHKIANASRLLREKRRLVKPLAILVLALSLMLTGVALFCGGWRLPG